MHARHPQVGTELVARPGMEREIVQSAPEFPGTGPPEVIADRTPRRAARPLRRQPERRPLSRFLAANIELTDTAQVNALAAAIEKNTSVVDMVVHRV